MTAVAAAPDRTALAKEPIPASGAWFPGDDPGHRQFLSVGELTLESGEVLPDVTLAYETFGKLAADGSNAILVLHAMTGDSHVHGPAGRGHKTGGWWEDLIGPGKPVDTERYFVVVPNVLGGCQGSTGPASVAPDGRYWGPRFPRLTTRDQVRAELPLAAALGVSSWKLVIGPSMGGCRALEWAIIGPENGVGVRGVAPLATTAQTSADQISWIHAQLAAIRLDPGFCGGDYYDQPAGHGPYRGLGLARQIAHATYRSERELDARFGNQPQDGEDPLTGGRFAVQSYLDYHGEKLARRFDANSYLVLNEAVLTHDVGRGRGGVARALEKITARALAVTVDTDRLYLPVQSAQIAGGIPNADPLRYIYSPYGHDGFLIEADQLGAIVSAFLESL